MKIFVLILTFLICCAKISLSQNFWMQTSFNWGGSVGGLTVTSNGYIFAGQSTGIFRSTDNCVNWLRIFQTPVEVYS